MSRVSRTVPTVWRSRALIPGLAAGVAVALALSAHARQGDEEAELPVTGREGLLQNDAVLPVTKAVAELLAAGDGALAAVEAAIFAGEREPTEVARRAVAKAVESWSAALRAAEPGEPVPLDLSSWLAAGGFRWPDPDGSFARRHEAVEYALLRRLAALPPGLRGPWAEREGPAAEAALAAAGAREPLLQRVEHLHAGTRGAALAALRLCDLAFERGHAAIAASWLERARLHAAPAGAADVTAAVASRAPRISPPASAAPAPPAWDAASVLSRAGPDLSVPLARAAAYRSSPAVPGLALLGGERVALQYPDVVWISAPSGRERGFEPPKLAEAAELVPPGPVAGPDAPWIHAPASDGERLFLVEGRAGPWPRGARPQAASASWHSNMLLCTRPPEELALPELVWALGPDVWLGPDGVRVPIADALGPGMWEFQPGPALAQGLLLVQARQWLVEELEGALELASPGEARVWALALDAASGAVVWKRWYAVGTDLVPDLGLRFRRKYQVRTAAQPLVLSGSRAFLPTSLGLGLLIDLADGRLVWSFANRRRDPEARGWQASRPPPLARGEHGGRELEAVLFAPPDSDHLYWLELDPDLEGSGILVHAPFPIGEGEALAGGDLERAYVLGRSGARRTLAMWEPESGRRTDSIYLGRGERFVPGALVGTRRALFASDAGIYLLDLERELYLLQHLPLELDLAAPPGGLFAHGDALWLLAERKLRRFDVD